MKTTPKYKEDNFKEVINSFKSESLEVKKVFKSGFFSGVGVVKNNKLAGRYEDVKFLESYEQTLKANFIKEGKILSSLNHESIPKLYDIVEQDNTLLFRTEHIEGYSLKEVLQALKDAKQTFPKVAATNIVLKLSKALNHAHNNVVHDGKKVKVIHCDIKPSNIILTAKNYKRKSKVSKKFLQLIIDNQVEPKLIDFGIAKLKGTSTEGTLPYLSKSQASNKALNWNTDTYQLALTYHEMLTLNNPFSNLKRSKTLELKSEYFNVEENLPNKIKVFIEKGLNEEFTSEKDSIKELKSINSKEKRIDYVKRNKKPLIAIVSILLLISLSLLSFSLYDKYVLSTDALIKSLGDKPTLDDLESTLKKVQKRSFEKKYLMPLLNGEFRDKETGEPIYPSNLDADGKWVFTSANEESAGAFTGLLFTYSKFYPKLLPIAIEYAEPILNSEIDGSSPLRFQYALIPAYEVTHNETYLDKLEDFADSTIRAFNIKKGMTSSLDIYQGQLLLWLYNEAGNSTYLEALENYMANYIENSIDDDGYVYEFTFTNASSPYGPIPNMKSNRLVTKLVDHKLGHYINNNLDFDDFNNITGLFSRDYIELLSVLRNLDYTTDNDFYDNTLNITLNYYKERMSKTVVDSLFVSYLNTKNNIPIDVLSTLKATHFFKDLDVNIYHQKLSSLLSSKYIKMEKDTGILSGNVLIEKNIYDHTDDFFKNQTLILTDKLFLELNI